MKRLFSKLRGAIREEGITANELAWKIGVSKSHMNDMLNNRSEPRLGECYAMLDALDRPHSDFHLYFPKGGQEDVSVPSLRVVGSNSHQRN